jgi:hypothetical protein
LLSAEEESTALMGEALQFKFNVALLKVTELDPNPVPLADARTLTGSKRRMEFWAMIAGTTKAEHVAITLQRRMDTLVIFGNSLNHPALKGDCSETPDTIAVFGGALAIICEGSRGG